MAQDDKKSFVAYLSWFDALEEYSDAEVGQLMRSLARYAKTGEEPEFSDRGMRGNWKFMCSDVKRASEKWDETRKKRSNAGKRGMAKRWGKPEDITKITNDNNVNDDITKITVDVDVNGDVDVDGDVDVVKRDNTAAVDMELSKIVQHYQRAIGDFPRSALEKLQKWRQEYSTEMILLAIDKAQRLGNARGTTSTASCLAGSGMGYAPRGTWQRMSSADKSSLAGSKPQKAPQKHTQIFSRG